MGRYSVALLGALVCFGAQDAAAQGRVTFTADCGQSVGQAYYLAPKEAQGWDDDRITNGSLLFERWATGVMSLTYHDSKGRFDAVSTGAKLTLVSFNAKLREFELVVTYPGYGVIETYSLHRLTSGAGRLLWTTNKTRNGGMITKVGAYTADCEVR